MSTSTADIAERFAAIAGADHVEFDPDRLARAFPTTAPKAHTPVGVVRPAGTAQVVALVKAALGLGVPLYPISGGRNWGYGDAAPPTAGQVVVDLARMNRIRHIDEPLAYAIIEPGVTQGALAEALGARGDTLWFDATGAGPDASIVGNVLERGFGHTAYGDRLRAVCGLEVVLGDGSLVRTGFSGVAGSAVGAVFPYGTGPFLDGLFTQSAFGIVTEMTIWLMPAPERFCAAVFQLERHDQIFQLVERLRALRLDGTLRTTVHIANDLRLISGRMRYPDDRTGGETPLPANVRAELCRELDVAPWTFSAALYGDRAQIRAAKRRLKAVLRGLDGRLHFVTDRKLAWGRAAATLTGFTAIGRRFRDRLGQIEPAIGLLKGKPNRAFLPGAYWRAASEAQDPGRLDPARDGCGLLWYGPVLPATAEDLTRFLDLAEPVFAAFGFDLLLTLSSVTERSLSAVMTIAFRREDAGECDRAAACYRELVEVTTRAGYPGYRANSQMMDAVVHKNEAYWRMVGRIKDALDPGGIIAPGRYSPLAPGKE